MESNSGSRTPTWADPDGYLVLARELAEGSHPWQWTLKAVRWGEFFKAPLYQVVLSVVTGHPAVFPFPRTGLLAHAMLDGVTSAPWSCSVERCTARGRA